MSDSFLYMLIRCLLPLTVKLRLPSIGKRQSAFLLRTPFYRVSSILRDRNVLGVPA